MIWDAPKKTPLDRILPGTNPIKLRLQSRQSVQFGPWVCQFHQGEIPGTPKHVGPPATHATPIPLP